MMNVLFRKEQTSSKSGWRKEKNNHCAWFPSEFNLTPTCCDVFRPAVTQMEARLSIAMPRIPQHPGVIFTIEVVFENSSVL